MDAQQNPQAPPTQQYPPPPAGPPPSAAQFPPPPPGPPPPSQFPSPPGPPLTNAQTSSPPAQPTSHESFAVGSASNQRPGYGYGPPKVSEQPYFPPPPNAPPTPATSYSGSPSSQYPPASHNQQWVTDGQNAYFVPPNAPPTPAASLDSRATSISQNPLPSPAPGYAPQYIHAAPGYGLSAPYDPASPQGSYFSQQPQQSQAPTQQPPTTTSPQFTGQNNVVQSPPAIESPEPAVSNVTFTDSKPPVQVAPQPQHPSASQEKANLIHAYSEPTPSTNYSQPQQYAAVQSPPPPPYSPNPQAQQNLHPVVQQEMYPQQQQVYNQQPSYQQQQQMEQQAQTFVQQQSPYYPHQQQQFTQVQVEKPIMGLQQPQYAQAQIQQIQPVTQSQPIVQSTYGQEAPAGILAHRPGKDDTEAGKVTRFLGDTLVGRFARSSVSTVTTTLKMPATLSPWGDNNPVTLPNVRYRDAALFGTFAVIGGPMVDGMANGVIDTFGVDHFISEVVGSSAGFVTGNTIVKYGVFQIVEQAIDKGVLEHALPEVEKTMRTTNAKTMQVCIKHKLMGVEADIRFQGQYPAANSMACDKGWFAPYLFASSRTPVIQRSQDFTMAEFFKPYLVADTALTHKMISESASVIPLCDPTPTARLSHARLLITFVGISPFRGEGSGMWSTSRRPGCGQLRIHLLNGCPTLVIPAYSDATRTPVLAWSPWTLKQMYEGEHNREPTQPGVYSPQKQHSELCAWLLGLIDRSGVHPSVASNPGSVERVIGKVVTMIINGAMTAPRGGTKICGMVDPERAGIVAMRF